MERAQIDTSGGNAPATLSALLGVLALAAGPAALVVQRLSLTITLHAGIAIGGAAAGALAILTLLVARHGRLRAERNIDDTGAGAARAGRRLGTLALCVAIAAGIALGTDAVLIHFQN
ncbi:MAG: hypothetical protein QOE29_2091 [Gaiellaceae bacterium]|jgi:hypothetical protein|nr:hypothetical protein [Gaiellaceae bacterium]